MNKLKTIKLNKTKGKNTIAKSEVFYWIDDDFKNYGTDVQGHDTKEMDLDILELSEDMTFKQMFLDPERQALTQSQIIEFCANHKEDLRQDGYATFFLFKENDEFFVADVCVYSVGLYVRVFRFEFDCVCFAEDRRRMVVPATSPSDTSLTLGHSEPLTDEQAITYLKSQGYCITRTETKEVEY